MDMRMGDHTMDTSPLTVLLLGQRQKMWTGRRLETRRVLSVGYRSWRTRIRSCRTTKSDG